MKTIEWRNITKTAWPRGPWDDEYDKKQWRDDVTGLPCLIVRNMVNGFLCGYIGVGSSHPCYQSKILTPIEIHGGLSFFGHCRPSKDEGFGICHTDPDETEPTWWFGFDCGHGFDYMPLDPISQGFGDIADYRTVAYVVTQIESLARQLKAMEPPQTVASL